MEDTLHKKRLILFLSAFVLCFCPVHSNAGSLVTRDDFMCFDTTFGNSSNSHYPIIALDGTGNLSQVNTVWQPPPAIDKWLLQFNRFDPNGSQLQPVTNIMPDTLGPDSMWIPTGLTMVYSNESGMSFVPANAYLLRPDGNTQTRGVLFTVFDTTGQMVADPLRVAWASPSSYIQWFDLATGGMNSSGTVGAAWMAGRYDYPLISTIMTRLYYPGTDSLSPFIFPDSLPHPLEQEPGYDGSYSIKPSVAMAVADDGGFAVAWIAGEGGFRHIYYVVYNFDYTPRSEVKMVECEGGFYDTALCATSNVHAVSIAMEADGDFYIAWFNFRLGASWVNDGEVWLRGFNADGTPKYEPIRLNDADSLWQTTGQLAFPFIDCNDSGYVLVAWADARLHPDNNPSYVKSDIYVQKIDPQGNLVGPNFRVNNITGVSGVIGPHLDCALNNAGQAVIIWRDWNQHVTIKAQLMPYYDIGTFVPGDINYDLSGDVADITALVAYLFHGAPNTFWPRDLINLDGDEWNGSVADLTYLVAYLFQGGPVPVTP